MKRVLILDDDRIFTLLAARANTDEALQVDSVTSVKQFKQTNLLQYDLFVIDYDLADGTGDQAIEYLAQMKIVRPTAMISASSRIKEQPANEHHRLRFISKWQDPESFMQELKNLV